MSYTDRPGYGTVEPATTSQVVEYHDRVRWGPVVAGFVVALGLQLVLSALGLAFGFYTLSTLTTPTGSLADAGLGVGIWTIISLFISLFLGGLTTARACGPMTRRSAILNGGVLWGLTLVFGSWLLASGVTGAFGAVLNLGTAASQVLVPPGGVTVPPDVTAPEVTPEQVRQAAESISAFNGWFAVGNLIAFLSAILGCAVGARTYRNGRTT